MKLKYERFEGLACLSIRGPVETANLKLLLVGLENIVKALEEQLMVNASLATIGHTEALVLNEFKKKASTLTAHTIYWVAKERPLGDFPSVELLMSRLHGNSKFRHVGERIRLDDETHQLREDTHIIEAKLVELGGDEANAHNIILENQTLKAQHKVLTGSIKAQQHRMSQQMHVPSLDEEIQTKTAEALAEFKKASGLELSL